MNTTLAADRHTLLRRFKSHIEALSDHTILLILLVLIASFHLLTLRSGYNLVSDSAQYVLHAKNIVEGRPYAAGYIFNPQHPSDPAEYPKGFPWLLVPVVAAFGVNVFALKILMTLSFVGVLGALWALYRAYLPRWQLCAATLSIGLCPILWELKHYIGSDIPFALFTLLAILGFEKARDSEGKRQFLWAVSAGLFGYYAVFTRSLGIVLLICFAVCAVVRFRLYFRPAFTSLLVAAFLYAILSPWSGAGGHMGPADSSNAVSGVAGGYSTIILHALHWMSENMSKALILSAKMCVKYAAFLSGIFDNGYSDANRIVLFALLTVLASVGFVVRLRRRFSVVELFFVLYFLALLPWGWVWSRYLTPIIPIYFVYMWIGSVSISEWANHRLHDHKIQLAPIVAVLIALTYLLRYTTLDYGPFKSEFLSPATYNFTEYVQENTPADAVLVSGLDTRGLALLTGRTFSPPHLGNARELLDYIEQINATYVVVPPRGTSRAALKQLVDEHSELFQTVYSNQEYTLYHVIPGQALGNQNQADMSLATTSGVVALP